jgi:uncharacterized membrane-anchored protein YhcB (DUF1043 family)
MVKNLLSFGMPGGFEWLVIMFVFFFLMLFWGLIVFGIIWLVRYLKRSSEEKQRLRMELGKLTDEMEQMRQEIESGAVKRESRGEDGGD